MLALKGKFEHVLWKMDDWKKRTLSKNNLKSVFK